MLCFLKLYEPKACIVEKSYLGTRLAIKAFLDIHRAFDNTLLDFIWTSLEERGIFPTVGKSMLVHESDRRAAPRRSRLSSGPSGRSSFFNPMMPGVCSTDSTSRICSHNATLTMWCYSYQENFRMNGLIVYPNKVDLVVFTNRKRQDGLRAPSLFNVTLQQFTSVK